jgi:hypothetical protein
MFRNYLAGINNLKIAKSKQGISDQKIITLLCRLCSIGLKQCCRSGFKASVSGA